MKGVLVLLLVLSTGHADPRGKAYEKEKVCKEFNAMGKDAFNSLAIILNSRKYSNATFEEISNIVREIVSLAETCCAKGAAPDCYDKRASALSARSCDPTSPFPKHPGTAACCVHQGLEQKLCLAALQQPPKEFPTYVEPSNEEVCAEFKKNPQMFSAKFLYEYSSNYAQTPLLVITNSTESFLKMAATCCTSKKPITCFAKQKLQRKALQILTVMSNRMCSRHSTYGDAKIRFSALVTFAQKVPSAEFKDVLPIVDECVPMLAKCCTSFTDNCMESEISTHVQTVCTKLSSKSAKVAECCKRTSIEALLCLHSMPSAGPIKLPQAQRPTNAELCNQNRNHELDKYTFEIARRNTKLPEAFVHKLHGAVQSVIDGCCAAERPNLCLANKRPQLRDQMFKFIAEANELCGDYNKYAYTEFKKRLTNMFNKKVPKPSQDRLTEMVEERANLASTCCSVNAPPVFCNEKIKTGMEQM
ncbi:vitamin D-binding protein [Ambystoma mexicanum]|uniref:vitamin D-binding protein n=1 Tax=Ambystoma mexicanum TaxID=8296 RepID=UPI0037E7045A